MLVNVLIQQRMSVETCRDHILVVTFGIIAVYTFLILLVILIRSRRHRGKRRNGQGHSGKDIEGRRNRVYEGDSRSKVDNEELPHDRKRQDSGFTASSNESIVPFPELLEGSSKRSPFTPTISAKCASDAKDEDIFDSNVKVTHSNVNVTPSFDLQTNAATLDKQDDTHRDRKTSQNTKDVGTNTENISTRETQTETPCQTILSINTKQDVSVENVVIEKKTFNCTGLDFGIAGIYIKDVDFSDITVKRGNLAPGDEVISINDFPLLGMSDMEAFSFFAKSGPEVTLKIKKNVFSCKVENASINGEKFTSDEMSMTKFTVDDDNNNSVNENNHERLPRVIRDANELSLDTTDCELKSKQECICYQKMANYPSNISRSTQCLICDEYTDAQNCNNNNNLLRFNTSCVVHPSICNEYCLNGKIVEQYRQKRRSSNENGRLSRNPSFDNERHSRNSSNENSRHSRNASSENVRQNYSPDEQTPTYHLTREESEEALKNIVYANGMLQRSGSADGTLPIFTIESFARSCERFPRERDPQNYLEFVRKRNTPPVDDGSHVLTDHYSEVPQALLSDSVMLQRGYNNDYIVPITAATHTSNIYTQKQNRGRENSPSRRTSPSLGNSSQINTRFSLAPLSISAATVARNASNSVIQASCTTSSPSTLSPPFLSSNHSNHVHRKPPPEYSTTVKRHDSSEQEVLSSPFTSENMEIDTDVMRYMTKKYSEPRFTNGHWKDPPPYSSAYTAVPLTNGVPDLNGIDTSNVILRRSRTSASEIRSRPHSMTETYGAPEHSDVANVYVQKKRKNPKRTLSLPALKHLEMRPKSAQVFLASNNVENLPDLVDKNNPDVIEKNIADVVAKGSRKKIRQQLDNINRRKSIDSGTLQRLAEEIQVNPALGGEYPIIAQLLGESQYSASERRAQGLYRHKSTEALSNQF